MFRSHFIRCAVLLVCFLAGCQGPAIGGRTTKPVPIVVHTQADDSGFQHAAMELINSQAKLESFGSTTLDALNVDFEKQSLLVLALGQKPTGGFSTQITGVQTRGSELYVQGKIFEPPPEAIVNQALTYPIAAAVIPKIRAALVHPEVDEVVAAPEE